MKKHILPGLLFGAMIAFAPSQINAQIRNDRGTFNMPGKGDILIETNASLDLSGGPVFGLNDGFLTNLNQGLNATAVGMPAGYVARAMPIVKMRKFMSNGMAARMMMNLSYSSGKTEVAGIENKHNNFGFALGLGLEKIFTPAERLNTYIGADVMVGVARIGVKTETAPKLDNHQTGFAVGFRAFTGMDYYVLPKVYLGLELGWGIGYNSYGVVNYNTGDNDQTSKSVSLSPFVNPQLRLGYVLGWTKKAHGNGEPTYRSNDGGDDE